MGYRNLPPRRGHVSHLIFQPGRLRLVAAEAFSPPPAPGSRVVDPKLTDETAPEQLPAPEYPTEATET